MGNTEHVQSNAQHKYFSFWTEPEMPLKQETFPATPEMRIINS